MKQNFSDYFCFLKKLAMTTPFYDFAGINSTSDPKCIDPVTNSPRPCTDYADFRKNGNTPTDSRNLHIEYAGSGESPTNCGGERFKETGLNFWKGRCMEESCQTRAAALVKYASNPSNLKQNPPSKGGN